MKLRWKILIAIAVCLVLVIIAAVVWHYQLRSATNSYIAQLKAQGEPLELSQVLQPPLPTEKNSADIIRQTAATLDNTEMWWVTNNNVGPMKMIAPGKAIVCSQQADIRGYNSTDSWETAGNYLAPDKKTLGLLRQIINKPDFDFQINYDAGGAGLNWTNLYLSECKFATERLAADAVFKLHEGDAASAIDDVRAILAMSSALRDERLLISELIRIAIVPMATAVNWEILQSSNVTDGQLEELQNSWSGMEFRHSMENALLMERAIGQITLEKWRDSGELQRYLDRGIDAEESVGYINSREALWRKEIITPQIFVWRYWWSYPDVLRSLQRDQIYINTLRLADTNQAFLKIIDYQNQKLAEWTATNDLIDVSDFHWIFSNLMSLRGIVRRIMTVEVAKQETITAIALKRYQLKYRNYPANLESLVPDFVSTIPLDPVDGQPLRCRLNADGTFLLYSVGPNGKDDGGNPALEKGVGGSSSYWLNAHALDWVWPQPASPKEIEYYYTHSRNN